MKTKLLSIISFLCILLLNSCDTPIDNSYVLIVNNAEESIMVVPDESNSASLLMRNPDGNFCKIEAKSRKEIKLEAWADNISDHAVLKLRIIKKSTMDKYTEEDAIYENYIFDKKIIKTYKALKECGYVIYYDGKD